MTNSEIRMTNELVLLGVYFSNDFRSRVRTPVLAVKARLPLRSWRTHWTRDFRILPCRSARPDSPTGSCGALWAAGTGDAVDVDAGFRQAQELGGHVRKGERGSLVVYADRIRKTEIDADTGAVREAQIVYELAAQALYQLGEMTFEKKRFVESALHYGEAAKRFPTTS